MFERTVTLRGLLYNPPHRILAASLLFGTRRSESLHTGPVLHAPQTSGAAGATLLKLVVSALLHPSVQVPRSCLGPGDGFNYVKNLLNFRLFLRHVDQKLLKNLMCFVSGLSSNVQFSSHSRISNPLVVFLGFLTFRTPAHCKSG